MSAPVKASPPDVERPCRDTPIWDGEFADRWSALQPLLSQGVEEDA